jgi:hypothetical protein
MHNLQFEINPMLISTTVRFLDVFFCNFQLAASKKRWPRDILNILLVFIVMVGAFYLLRGPADQAQWIRVVIDAFILLVLYELMWFVVVPALAALAALNTVSIGEHTFEIGEEAFIERSKMGERVVSWGYVNSIELLRDFLVVKIGRFDWFIIPASAFSSRSEFEEFYAELCCRKNTT